MKKYKNIVISTILFILLLIYVLVGDKINLYIPCPIKFITGLYCLGCGITRMILSILKWDLYQAFRYNPLVFILMPFIIFYFLEIFISKIYNKKSICKRIPDYVFYILIVILIVYGILRNIDMFSYLKPTIVRWWRWIMI